MVTIWNESRAYLSPYRTVFAQQAPKTLAALDAKAPGEIGQGNYIKTDYDDQLLNLLQRPTLRREVDKPNIDHSPLAIDVSRRRYTFAADRGSR
jgi:hypothetical protein